jgi:hypothetical protein
MDRLYPSLAEHLEEKQPPSRSTANSTGTAYFQPIREGCQTFFIPKLEGG